MKKHLEFFTISIFTQTTIHENLGNTIEMMYASAFMSGLTLD